MLVLGARRVLGVTIPPLKHFGPLLVVWGASMLMLVVIRDLGSSLMFFGAFLALLYVATGRLSFVVAGLVLFVVGAWFFAAHGGARPGADRHLARSLEATRAAPASRSRSRCSRRPTAGCSARGSARRCSNLPGGAQIPPAPDTDLIYAVITNELGLFGAAGVVLTYLLFAERGFRIAVMADDGFLKLLATGLTAVFALQAFVIVGGVTRVIPLTGVTLPFVSYGGSSIVANFVLLALLLMVSQEAREPRAAPHSPVVGCAGPMNGCASAQPLRARRAAVRRAGRLHVVLVGVRRGRARGKPREQAAAARAAADPARPDPGPRRHGAGPQQGHRAAASSRFYRRLYPDRRPVLASGGLQLRRARQRRGSSAPTTTISPARRTSSRRSSTSCAARSARATTSSPRSTREAQRTALAGARRAGRIGGRDRAADRAACA